MLCNSQHPVETPSCRHEAQLTNRRARKADALPIAYRNRPYAIRTAISAAPTIGLEHGLTRTSVAVLQAIIATGVSTADPLAFVFAKKRSLARLAGCSEASVYRALSAMEAAGMIRRQAQDRCLDGTHDIALVSITKALATQLNLVIFETKENSQISNDSNVVAMDNNEHEGENTACAETSLIGLADSPCADRPVPEGGGRGTTAAMPRTGFTQPSVSGLQDGLRDGPIRSERGIYPEASVNHQSRPGFVRMDGRSIPEKLVWLISDLKLGYGRLFKLMRLCRQKGAMLEDYVEFKSQRLRSLISGNDIYRYLKSFIVSDFDVVHLLKERAKAQDRAKDRSTKAAQVASRQAWARARDGRVFRDTNGRTYQINAHANVATVGIEGVPSALPCIRIGGKFVADIEAGRLQPFVEKRDIEAGMRGLARLFGENGWLRSKTA